MGIREDIRNAINETTINVKALMVQSYVIASKQHSLLAKILKWWRTVCNQC